MKNLKTIRQARGLTQEQCCERVSQATGQKVTLHRWMRWENHWQNGKNDPPPAMRDAIADLLDTSLDQLAGRVPFDVLIAS